MTYGMIGYTILLYIMLFHIMLYDIILCDAIFVMYYIIVISCCSILDTILYYTMRSAHLDKLRKLTLAMGGACKGNVHVEFWCPLHHCTVSQGHRLHGPQCATQLEHKANISSALCLAGFKLCLSHRSGDTAIYLLW